MKPIAPNRAEELRERKRLNLEIRASLRELGIQLTLLNHHIGGQLDLKDVDLDCLDLIALYGPLSPSVLAQQAGLHRATMTGILDRLEGGSWVARERDPVDRRAVRVRVLRDRTADLKRLYQGMSASMNRICAGYQNPELALLADFLRRTASAAQTASDDTAGD
jgi:DNA-binding MarR family transcriptional regulator